jgi:lipopolysaccharide transport system permease protein
MSQDRLSGSSARPLASAEIWTIAPDLRLGVLERGREIWRYRRVFAFFAFKAVQTLYSNTKLGPTWLLIRPLAPLAVGSIVFGAVMGVPSLGVPYFLFFLAGSIVWSLFTEPVTRGSRAFDINRQLLKKLYLPRVILPAGQLAAGLVEPVVLTGVYVAAVFYYRWADGIWYVPPLSRVPAVAGSLAATLTFAFAVTLWTSVLQARARDIRYMIGYILSFWMFLTPVIYPLEMVPANLQWLAALNPLTAPVETFKWGLFNAGAPAPLHWIASGGGTVLTLWLGLWFFSRAEGKTVDSL